VYDLKSSSIVRDAVTALGATAAYGAQRARVYQRPTFLKNHSALAGEISGHFFFGELGMIDGILRHGKDGGNHRKKRKAFVRNSGWDKKDTYNPDIRCFLPLS
jgi:phosphomannomutase/phosphoglucomutase